jgi:SAM-dependent methyltransferase
MEQANDEVYKRAFWADENLKYTEPHFRLEKSARIVRAIARGKESDLLDVGCGPATLQRLLPQNVHYYGIDIAIHIPAPNLLETDFLENPIKFGDKTFDIVVAQGVFEYAGRSQSQKFSEIARLLNTGGTFFVSYVNFDHINKMLYRPYSNIQSFDEFRQALRRFFRIDRVIPTSHHWHHREPTRRFMKDIQMHTNTKIPLISSRFAIEYFFVCSVGSGKR